MLQFVTFLSSTYHQYKISIFQKPTIVVARRSHLFDSIELASSIGPLLDVLHASKEGAYQDHG